MIRTALGYLSELNPFDDSSAVGAFIWRWRRHGFRTAVRRTLYWHRYWKTDEGKETQLMLVEVRRKLDEIQWIVR